MNKNAVCTVITKSYLPYARTLANSLAEHNPDIDLYVLLADKVDGYFDPALEPFKFIYLEDLSDTQTVEQMCFYYTPFELCCALRGFLHEYMFEQTDVQKWLFLDSDIIVFNSLKVIFDQLENKSILLTPHTIVPFPIDNIEYEINFLRNGLYNAGFLGLRKTKISQKFISWFKRRLNKFAFNDFVERNTIDRGLFVDQLWLNLVPLYFDEVDFCLESGANLGHWNLFGKILTKEELGVITVDEKPLLFVHFSGWNIDDTSVISKYAPIYHNKEYPVWTEISEIYKNKLLKNGYKECLNHPYSFNYFHNGEIITNEMRRTYYDHLNMNLNVILENSPFSEKVYSWLIHHKNHDQSFTSTRSLLRKLANLFINIVIFFKNSLSKK